MTDRLQRDLAVDHQVRQLRDGEHVDQVKEELNGRRLLWTAVTRAQVR